MSLHPDAVRRALQRLERRLFRVLLLYGTGLLAAAAAGALAALYLLDRIFEPPPPVRLVLLATALGLLGAVGYRCLWLPLQRRPRPRDLAALWERSHPELADRLATAVELPQAPAGTSAALLAVVHAEAAAAAAGLEPRRAVPGARARRGFAAGLAALGLLGLLAALAPAEARVFLQRMLGRDVSWPRDTELVLLAPHREGGEAPPLERDGPGSYRMQAPRGSVLTVRVRAQGVVPDRVLTRGMGPPRPMRPVGDGEFVLRLPPLLEPLNLHFEGGDDDDGSPRLALAPGIAPAVVDWSVLVEPPTHTGFPAEQSSMNEFRVPEGTRLSARFRTDRPVRGVTARALNGTEEPLAAGGDGFYLLERTAQAAGEVLLGVRGEDGYEDPRAAVLRWQAVPDRPPRLEFRLPSEHWTTVDGGAIPVLLFSSDEFGLAEVLLASGPIAAPIALPLAAGARELQHFEVLPAPAEASALEPTAARRFRLEAWARDTAQPESHASQTQSPWIEVVPPAVYDERLGERMIQVRERVERLRASTLAYTHPASGTGAESPLPRARRLRRDLESLQGELERILTERLYTRLDRGSDPALERLEALFRQGPAASGAVTATLASVLPPLDRAGLLLDLARAAGVAREGPANDLVQAATSKSDPLPAAQELQVQLDAMLEILLAWEDFQSAVNLLRGMLERQSNLYLRTQEASTR